jgi:hypothetical protein
LATYSQQKKTEAGKVGALLSLKFYYSDLFIYLSAVRCCWLLLLLVAAVAEPH